MAKHFYILCKWFIYVTYISIIIYFLCYSLRSKSNRKFNQKQNLFHQNMFSNVLYTQKLYLIFDMHQYSNKY